MPASSRASLKASTIRDSGLRSQSSPNLVHPMPTMATLSLIPSAMLPPFSSVRICHLGVFQPPCPPILGDDKKRTGAMPLCNAPTDGTGEAKLARDTETHALPAGTNPCTLY